MCPRLSCSRCFVAGMGERNISVVRPLIRLASTSCDMASSVFGDRFRDNLQQQHGSYPTIQPTTAFGLLRPGCLDTSRSSGWCFSSHRSTWTGSTPRRDRFQGATVVLLWFGRSTRPTQYASSSVRGVANLMMPVHVLGSAAMCSLRLIVVWVKPRFHD